MKHFSDIREKARNLIVEPEIRKQGEKWCLAWDLRGRLRLLCWPGAGTDIAALTSKIDIVMKDALGDFWTGEVWFWDKKKEGEKVVIEQGWKEASLLDASPPEVRELNRRLSKGAWFGQPIIPPWPINDKTVPILAFFSFKGGVGRTTALSSVAIQLARANKRVCVIDLDLEAPGAGVSFPLAGEGPQYGVVDYLLERPQQVQAATDMEDYVGVCDAPEIIGGTGAPITVVPAGRLDDEYLEKLARVDYEGLLHDEKAGELPLVSLVKSIKNQFKADYILLDSRAGLHDIGGLALNGLAHLDVVFGLDNEQSWAGMKIVISHLGRQRIEWDLLQQNCAFVYAMAPPASSKDRLNRVQAFADRSHALFSEEFYNAEPSEGWSDPIPENVWPVPAADAVDEPHFPLVLEFNTEIQQARSLNAIADMLTHGDYRNFFSGVLNRIGRTES